MRYITILLAGMLAFGTFSFAFAETNAGEKSLDEKSRERAIFAGGCFWGMEAHFESLDGVTEVVSGYTGGHKEEPTYEEVCSGRTGHAEAIEITFDPSRISYEELLEEFWSNVDPTEGSGEFVDSQYRSAIFFLDGEQERLARASRERLTESGRFDQPILTRIEQATSFFKAEEYHQDYYRKSKIPWRFYRMLQ